MEYRTLWEFQVQDAVQKGKTVFCTDRQNRMVYEINDMPWSAAIKLLADSKAESDEAHCGSATRYEFWYEEETQEVEDDDAL